MKVSSRLLMGVIVGIASLGLVLWLWPRQELPVEEAVRTRILELVRAAERKEADVVKDALAQGFRTREGMGRDDVRRLLAVRVLRGSWVRIFVTDLAVRETSPSSATFDARFVFARSEAERIQDLGRDSILEAYQIEGTFVREDDGVWRISAARHRRLAPHELF